MHNSILHQCHLDQNLLYHHEFTNQEGCIQTPREGDQGCRRSGRIMKKQSDSHPRRHQEHQTIRPVTSKDVNCLHLLNWHHLLRNKSEIYFLVLKKAILESLRDMMIVIVVRAICPKGDFGDLKTFHQVLKIIFELMAL
jgi:hypothetical protein